jgi:hypothetical protein
MRSGPTEDWWRHNLDLSAYYSFHALNRLLGNIDLRPDGNHGYYRRPDGRWAPIPWDLDMMFVPRHHQPGHIDAIRCLGHPAIAREYRNRAREILDLFAADGSERGGQVGQLAADLGAALTPMALDAPSPVVALAPTIDDPITERPGTVIGPYKLMEQIGEGGMGLVFVVEQQQPFRRKVALKVIKPGMDTRQVIARFEAERQALAMMDHANIAKVYDGGVTPEGRPYFVMELVKGTPITDYCDAHRLSTRQRLELFRDVCQAVQHAHQKGIIHRDLRSIHRPQHRQRARALGATLGDADATLPLSGGQELLRVARALEDGLPSDAGDVADDLAELEVHLL